MHNISITYSLLSGNIDSVNLKITLDIKSAKNLKL